MMVSDDMRISKHRVWNYQSLRIYLSCKMLWFFASGFSYMFTYKRLETNSAFEVVDEILTLRVWGFFLIGLGVAACTTVLWTTTFRARSYFVVCFGVEILFALGIFVTWTWSPLVWTYMLLAAFDFFIAKANMVER